VPKALYIPPSSLKSRKEVTKNIIVWIFLSYFLAEESISLKRRERGGLGVSLSDLVSLVSFTQHAALDAEIHKLVRYE
jgi:hypothetical protein